MLMRITFHIAAIVLVTTIATKRNTLLLRGYIAILMMIKSKICAVVVMMMLNQSRASMNAPKNEGDSYQHQGKSSEHDGILAMDL